MHSQHLLSFSVDATLNHCLGRYANDAWKSPNAKVLKILIDGTAHLVLVARCDILPGDEIRYDYGRKDAPWRQVRQQVCNLTCYND